MKVVKKGFVQTRHWGPDDDYLVVEVQVFSDDGFKNGDTVEVTIEKKDELKA